MQKRTEVLSQKRISGRKEAFMGEWISKLTRPAMRTDTFLGKQIFGPTGVMGWNYWRETEPDYEHRYRCED
jgi:hypothetical protein